MFPNLITDGNRVQMYDLWVYHLGEHLPSDWLSVDEGSIRHDFHPRLHLFGCVSAEIIRPHVGVSSLAVWVEREKLKVTEG